MHIRQINLNLLTVFDAIMGEKHVGRAATRLGLTQSATSQSLKRLRTLTGDKLFVRTGRGVSPTPLAIEMAEPIRNALDLVESAFSEHRDFDFRQSDRVFSISMPAGYEAVALPRFTNWLATVSPDVRLIVTSAIGSEVFDDLKEGRVDLAMSLATDAGPSFQSELLFNDDLVVLARRDHPIVKDRITIEQYLTLGHVVLQVPIPHGLVITGELKRKGLIRRVMHEVPSLTSIPGVVASTDLIATQPLRIARAYADHLNLRILPPPTEVPPVEVYQIWHSRSENDAAHQWLRRSFRDICRQI